MGPGLLESAYEACLCAELTELGLEFEQQRPLKLAYKGAILDCGYRLDLVVENRVLLELKAVEALLPIHEAQLSTYLKLSKLKIGLLINFNTLRLKAGVRRRVV